MQLEDAPTSDSRKNLEYRYAYAEDFLNTWVATQIVTLREQRGLKQDDFGRLIGTKQPGVSRLENVNHSTWKTETLKRIARALGVRLKISFESFGTLLSEDERFSRQYLKRPKFEDDPAFVERKGPQSVISETPPMNAVSVLDQARVLLYFNHPATATMPHHAHEIGTSSRVHMVVNNQSRTADCTAAR
jgi:transcriptional regulator with XRE-family HTH domain